MAVRLTAATTRMSRPQNEPSEAIEMTFAHVSVHIPDLDARNPIRSSLVNILRRAHSEDNELASARAASSSRTKEYR